MPETHIDEVPVKTEVEFCEHPENVQERVSEHSDFFASEDYEIYRCTICNKHYEVIYPR